MTQNNPFIILVFFEQGIWAQLSWALYYRFYKTAIQVSFWVGVLFGGLTRKEPISKLLSLLGRSTFFVDIKLMGAFFFKAFLNSGKT